MKNIKLATPSFILKLLNLSASLENEAEIIGLYETFKDESILTENLLNKSVPKHLIKLKEQLEAAVAD